MTLKAHWIQVATAGLVAAAALAAPVAHAQSQAPDDWRFRAAIYGWFPSLDGTTQFPASGASGPSFKVDASTILDNLSFAFMGTFEAQRGNWGVFVDYFYANVDGSVSGTRDFSLGQVGIPASASANFDLSVKTNLLTMAGTYAVVEEPTYSVAVLAGARMLSVDQTLNWTLNGNLAPIVLPGRTGSVDASLTNWDAIVGVRGRLRFGDDRRWFVPYYADVGGGQSKLTWQVWGGIGYSFKWGEIAAAWRYLDYEFKSGDPLQTLSFNGPAVGVIFNW